MKLCFSLLLGLMFSWFAFGQSNIPIKQKWDGSGLSNDLKAAAPDKEFIADQASWKKIWTAWRGSEKLPTVDFRKEVIIFCITQYPNRCSMTLTLKGNKLQTKAMSTLIGSRQAKFNYQLVLLNRAGIKAINDEPLSKK